MKNINIYIIAFLAFSFNSQGQHISFNKEEKKAKEFMESKILEIYNGQFKTEFIGTWNEFGKIYGFKFYVIENSDNPIAVEYNLEQQDPFEFDKDKFEKEYESIKIKIAASVELEKDIRIYYPNARAIANRIENNDKTYRWVNEIYTAQPLEKEKERTFTKLDSLSALLGMKNSGQEVIFNFYFTEQTDKTKYTIKRFPFFEYENFNSKYIHHYRIDLNKKRGHFEISNANLYDNLSEEQTKKLMTPIRIWRNKNGFEYWKIYLLTESSIERDIDYKKFMLKSTDGEKKFGFINIETKELKFEN